MNRAPHKGLARINMGPDKYRSDKYSTLRICKPWEVILNTLIYDYTSTLLILEKC